MSVSKRTSYVVLLVLTLMTAFMLRLSLLTCQTGEYTDGIHQMTLFSNHKSYWPPLYAALLQVMNLLVGDLEKSGRLVSALMGSLALIPTYFLGRRIYSPKVGLYAAVLMVVSAEPLRWDTKVMTDATFTCLFMTSLLFFVRFLEKPEPFRFGVFLAFSGLSVLSRYEGFIFLPFLGLALVLLFRQSESSWRKSLTPDIILVAIVLLIWSSYVGLDPKIILIVVSTLFVWKHFLFWIYGLKKHWRSNFWLLIGLLPWIALIVWFAVRGFGHIDQYSKRAGRHFFVAFQAYFVMGEIFLMALPWALTYPVALFCMIGSGFSFKGSRKERYAILTMGFIFVAWLIAHSAFKAFQIRYFYPLFPLFFILAAKGIEATAMWANQILLPQRIIPPDLLWIEQWTIRFVTRITQKTLWLLRKAPLMLLLCVIGSSILSALFFYHQRDSFGEIKRAALYVRDHIAKESPIYADETVKMSFWAGRKVKKLRGNQFKKGDYLVFSDFYTANLSKKEKELRRKYRLKRVFEDRSKLVPLLPDIMVNPRYKMHHPGWIAYKFKTQRFRSVVYHIEDLLQDAKPKTKSVAPR